MSLEIKPQKTYNVGKADEVYHLQISDHILDSLYGQIGITEVEKQIERLAIFKRLHSVSQLGLVNWIFPCALHTRYTHSIGVMHIAGQMAEHINQNVWRVLGNKNFFDDCDIQIVRLAGLLHDIGHYPMSHNVEQAYREAYKIVDYERESVSQHLKHYVNCPEYLHPDYVEGKKGASFNSEDFNKDYAGSRWPHHESAGQAIVRNSKDIAFVIKWYFVLLPNAAKKEWVLNPKFSKKGVSTYTDKEVNEIVDALTTTIGDIIIGNYGRAQEYSWQEKYSAMIQLIHSDLDADNLDYLLRDATFSGTSYGVMDMGVLLNCLTVSELEWAGDFDTEKRYLVGIKRKGLGCVEQFLVNKFLAYTQMIFSKYTSVLEAMLLRLMADGIAKQTDVYRIDGLNGLVSSKETCVDYLKFSDHYIFEKLFVMSQTRGNLAALPNAIVSRLTHSCAFNLENGDSECICASTSKNGIRDVVISHPMYKRFLKIFRKVKDLEGKTFKSADHCADEEKLFSFRFEEYCLTHQIPLKGFCKMIRDPKCDATRADRHYYRLACGIPILEDNASYEYHGETKFKECEKVLPPLCVDCAQSVLHQIYDMRYVSFRQYKVEEYEEPSVC